PLTHLCYSSNTTPTEIYTLSLHDALPIFDQEERGQRGQQYAGQAFGHALQGAHGPLGNRRLVALDARGGLVADAVGDPAKRGRRDRKSTRLNSSHVAISYAVFCVLKIKFV